jgi:hypothetical protein
MAVPTEWTTRQRQRCAAADVPEGQVAATGAPLALGNEATARLLRR